MNKTTQMVAEFEQIETVSTQVAQVMASYYKDLLKNGVPVDLAYILTQEFHRQWWVIPKGDCQGLVMLSKKPEGGKGV